MDKFDFFWDTVDMCDWEQEGDDKKVLEPVVDFLSKQSDEKIFLFEDLMSELLYNLDTKVLYEQCADVDEYAGPDSFLYSRCAALINGRKFYDDVLNGNNKEVWSLEFESLLYVSMDAWAKKHGKNSEDYPHFPPLSYETGSNKAKY